MSDKLSPYKLDEAGGVFFTRQLEYIKAGAIEEKLAPLSYQMAFPISAEMPLGATNFTWRTYKSYGLARMISDYAKDFPRSEIGASEQTVTAKDLGASYGYTIAEIRRAQYAGVDLERRKAVATRRAIEQKLNDIAWNGDADYGLQGLISYPGISSYTVPATGTGTSKLWANKTADQILTDLNGIKNSVGTATNFIEEIDTILLPPLKLDLIKNLRMSSYNDTSVYEWFKRNNPGIEIMAVRELTNKGTGGNTDTMIAYKRDSEHLEFQVPLQFEQFESQQDGLQWVIPCMARTAGMIVYYPLAVSKADSI